MLVDINGDGDYDDPNEDQSCNFSITIEDDQSPDAVCLDVDRTTQILTNLVDNRLTADTQVKRLI